MQLQQNLSRFEAADIAVFAISYDPVETQAAFADEFGITFPLLADPDSAVISATGILNTLVEPGDKRYGVPFPGSYIVGVDGTIEEKSFFETHRTRPSAETLLRDGFGLDFEIRDNPHAEAAGAGVSVSATLGSQAMVFGEESAVYVDLLVDEGVHVYAAPAPDGFVAAEVSVEGPDDVEVGATRFPTTMPFRVEGMPEQFNVFEPGRVSISVPIVNMSQEPGEFALTVTVRYQACTEAECFIPQTHRLRLDARRVKLTLASPS